MTKAIRSSVAPQADYIAFMPLVITVLLLGPYIVIENMAIHMEYYKG